jgi:hypothetical protein
MIDQFKEIMGRENEERVFYTSAGTGPKQLAVPPFF